MTISLDTSRYTVGMATSPADLQAAQRLRYEVFAEEMGARLDSPVSGLDVDRFDAYCDHLLVREGRRVVGTYRLLPPGRADRLYSDTEFDLRALAPIRKRAEPSSHRPEARAALARNAEALVRAAMDGPPGRGRAVAHLPKPAVSPLRS
ncbi:GNAT family N-acetyltransferase [Nonomuraea sp. NPDC052265]|uniref:GNAT family N-acetyltransferase n=1 Tax=Nonomuraea sp. NPDC052265 TaxID=3364374 RepID=UPI0037C9A475